MKTLIRVTLALAAAVVCPFVAAQPARLSPEAAIAHEAAATAALRARRTNVMPERSAAASVAAADSVTSGPRLANPYRAYPPSCLADPLPDTPNGPDDTFQMSLYTRDDAGNPLTPETVTVTLWRIACSSSGALQPYNTDGGANAALLMRIERDVTNDGHMDYFPTFPLLSSTQGSAASYVRAAMEPNTVVSDGPFDGPIYDSTTYVLENYPARAPYIGYGYTYFDYDFSLIIDPVIGGIGTSAVTRSVNAYNPSQSQYPAAYQNLPIDGYMSSAYYNPAHSGEGLVVEVYDNPGNTARTIFGSWYTYDSLGLPFWLVIQGVVPIGSNALANAPVYYYTGGGFAGNFGASVDSHSWGTASLSWPDCNTLQLSYNGSTDASIGGPSGSGTVTWQRLSDINGLNCE